MFKRIALVWKLLRDPRVPGWLKFIAFASLFYALIPVDLFPDIFPAVGFLDDIVFIATALTMLLKLTPKKVVNDNLRRLEQKRKDE